VPDKRSSPLGEFIRQQRELSELSMRQFASMVGISNPYLSQIERGLREPSDKVLESIAERLQLSADALYEQAGRGDDEPLEEPPTREAICEDPLLTPRQRQALVRVYDAFVEANGDGRRRRRRERGGR
jgi:transcriptional regulator with XRE-family HTH domain